MKLNNSLYSFNFGNFVPGFALGLQLPTQYLITAEVGTPERRTVLSLLVSTMYALDLNFNALCKADQKIYTNIAMIDSAQLETENDMVSKNPLDIFQPDLIIIHPWIGFMKVNF